MDTPAHISVCVCTYKRTRALGVLMDSLLQQVTRGQFSYSIVIIDNDAAESARDTVNRFREAVNNIEIDYAVEPEQNISLARNRAIGSAKGSLIAFIDDDEYPSDDWLLNLFKAYKSYSYCGMVGPVRFSFQQEPPEWLIRGGFFQRNDYNYRTGAALQWYEAYTGNALISSGIFKSEEDFFDRSFGKTGGEDLDLFFRLYRKGYRLGWCQEAVVYEAVPFDRCAMRYFLRRYLRPGGTCAKIKAAGGRLIYRGLFFAKSTALFFIYLGCLPLALLLGRHLAAKCLARAFYNLGKILFYCCGYIVPEYGGK